MKLSIGSWVVPGLLFWCGLGLTAGAETGNNPLSKTAAQELLIDLGPRPLSLGGAFVALADDVNATAWNPAGLAKGGRPEIGFNHSVYLQDSSLEYMAYSRPLSSSTGLGLYAMMLNYGTMDRVIDNGGVAEVTGQFTPMTWVVGGGYGFTPFRGVQTGITLKGYYQSVDTDHSMTAAADIGVLTKTGVPDLQLGATLKNVGLPVNGYSLPATASLGASYAIPLKGLPQDKWRIAVEARAPFVDTQHPSLHAGMEYAHNRVMAVRLGAESDGQSSGDTDPTISAGLGFRLSGITIDYAAVSYGKTDLTHQIMFTITLGKPTPPKKQK